MILADLSFISGTGEGLYHPGKNATILFKEKQIGQLGVVHPRILKFIGIAQTTIAFEVYLENLEYQDKTAQLSTSDYQSVERDFAFIVDNTVSAQRLIEAVRAGGATDLIKKISLFDVFYSEEFGSNKKSLAVRVVLQAADRTLTSDDIEKLSQAIISSVCSGIAGAVLREGI